MTTSATVDGDVLVLTIDGALDLTCADGVVAAGVALLGEHGSACELVLDLSGVGFVDSSGLSAFVRLRRAAADRGATLSLRGVPHTVAVLLRIAGLDTLFASA